MLWIKIDITWSANICIRRQIEQSWYQEYFLDFRFIHWRSNPPAPMNNVKYLRAGPAEMPFQNWYTANTNHFFLTDSVSLKSKTQLGWVINPVPHNFVRRREPIWDPGVFTIIIIFFPFWCCLIINFSISLRRIRFWRIKVSGTWFYIFVLDNK